MRRLLRPAPLAVVLVALGLALGSPQAGAITDGTADTTHTNVGLLYMNDVPVLEVGACSGALIAPDVFLVAGHCTAIFGSLLSPADLSVSFDQRFSLTDSGVITAEHPIAVESLVTHPGYVGVPYSPTAHIVNDVGVVRLSHRVRGVTPVQLPPSGFLDQQASEGALQGQEFVNVGYGINSLDRSWFSPQANWTWDTQREFSTSLFRALWPNNLRLSGGTCEADSGGPRFYGNSNLEVAVTSTGDPTCGALDTPQRLDTESVHDWLEQFTD